MPDKNPEFWAAILAWLAQNYHAIAAGAMSFAVAVVRIIYSKERGPGKFIEALLCALIAVAISSALKPAGIDPAFSTFFGSMVGFYGVDTFRAVGLKFIERKTGATKR